jgi:hypothetical protein
MMRTLIPISLFLLAPLAAAQLTVVSVSPALNAGNRAANESIVVDFDRPVLASSLSSAQVYGNLSGSVIGSLTLENGDTRIRFRPQRAFMANEIVHLTLDKGLKAQDGTQIRPQGYAASFRIATAPATRQFLPSRQYLGTSLERHGCEGGHPRAPALHAV